MKDNKRPIIYLGILYPDYKITKDGEIWKDDYDENGELEGNHLITPRDDGRGYHQVDIKGKDGLRKTVKVHLAMMHTWKPLEDYSGMIVNHKDGNKKNNKLINLEWLTYRGNTEHAMKTGLRKDTTYLGKSKVMQIVRMLKKGMSLSDISAETEVSKHIVMDIKRKKSYSFYTNDIDF
jgi:hypothetical protein